MAEAATEQTEIRKGPSMVVQTLVFLVLTLAAIGGGWMTGRTLNGEKAETRGTGAQIDADRNYKDEDGSDKAAQSLRIFRLETITTNLSDPQDIWVRLELALVFTDRPDPEVAEMVHQDLLAYLRTVKARQIDGPSGFQHLRSDLDERARIRSEGKVRHVLIRTMLFE
jgi:flagellar protein FliL